jgi:hypothetical protein
MPPDSSLVRGLGLREATASNVVTMVGSAILVTLPLVLSAMGGPQARDYPARRRLMGYQLRQKHDGAADDQQQVHRAHT